MKPSTGQVAFGVIRIGENVVPPEGHLEGALTPGTRIERFNREWMLGTTRASHVDGQLRIGGRLGFQRVGSATEIWDEKAKDFRPVQHPEGASSPYSIDVRRGRVAFQLRPGLIRRQSFCGALEAILRESDPGNAWTVHPELRPTTYEEWVESVDRITRFHARLELPNPNFLGRPTVKKIMEGFHAGLVTIEAKAAEGESIDLTDDVVIEVIDHAVTREYGSVKIDGVQQGRKTTFDSAKNESPPELRLELPKGIKDVSLEALGQVVNRPNITPPTSPDPP